MNESPGTFELLSDRVEELERRVHALEHPCAVTTSAISPVVAAASARLEDEADSLQTANIFPLLGRAMLGIAGAYVLRAIAEAGVMPKGVAAFVAIAYALAWLLWAVRVPRLSGIAPVVYASTSAMILVPMLWEETLHFHVFAPVITAGVLAYSRLWRQFWSGAGSLRRCCGLRLGLWLLRRSRSPSQRTQCCRSCSCCCLSLCCAKCARAVGRARPMWPLVALAADAAVLGMMFVYSGPLNARAEYPELSVAVLVFPALLLFAISASSVVGRVFVEKRRIGVLEIVQVMITFGLAVSSVLSFAPKTEIVLGLTCLMLSAATYGASFRYLRPLAEPRDFLVFSMWSAALLIAGALWSLPRSEAEIGLATAGLAAYFVAERLELPILELQGAIFLCAAALVSDVTSYVFGALAGAHLDRSALAAWVIGGTATAAYFVAKDSKDAGWTRQILRLVAATLGVSAIAALAVEGMMTLARFGVSLDTHHIAFLRTLVISTMSLALAFAGSRWGRVTMTRLAYVALAFLAAKLIFEDLRHGHMEFIAGSIFLFAITLIAVPRLVRMGANSRAALQPEMMVAGKR